MAHEHEQVDEARPWVVWMAFSVIALFFVLRNLPWTLDGYSQAEHARATLQMSQTGDWLHQRTATGELSAKPPLHGWLACLFYYMMGGHGWAIAWRLPSLIAAALLLRALWQSGTRQLGSNLGGLLAAGAFGLNEFAPRLAMQVGGEMLHALALFMVGDMILSKIRREETWAFSDQCKVAGWLLIATLIKGPTPLTFIAPALLLFLVLGRGFGLPTREAWFGVWPWLPSLAVLAAWVALGTKSEPTFFTQTVLGALQSNWDLDFARSEGWLHAGPQSVLFYPINLLVRFLPWSLLFFLLLVDREVRFSLREDPPLLWTICWAFAGLILLSVAPGKDFDRILPVAPALCMAIVAMTRRLRGETLRGLPMTAVCVLTILTGVLFGTIYGGYKVISGYRSNKAALVRFADTVNTTLREHPGPIAVVESRDPALPIYLGICNFTPKADALQRWKLHQLDYLVLEEGFYQENLPEFGKHNHKLTSTLPRTSDTATKYVHIEHIRQKTTPSLWDDE